MRALLRTALAAALLVAGTGCAGEPEDEPTAGPSSKSPEAPTSSASADPQSGGKELDWRPTGKSPDDRYIQGSDWAVSVDRAGTTATFDGPQRVVVRAGGGRQVSDVQLNEEWGLVVAEDPAGDDPQVATVVDLTSGETRAVDDPAPGPFGDWSLHGDHVLYGATDAEGAYCLADLDLAAGSGDVGSWCAGEREGFTNVTETDSGITLMAFDDERPVSCKTLAWVTDSGIEPLPHVTECIGWDVAATPTGVVWSEVPKPRRQESARFFASRDGEVVELGAGTTGSLTPCGDSVFFTRDSARGKPARLVQWTADGEQRVAFEARPGGQSFLGEPACAGDVLTISSFAEGGDEQVWASVG